MTGDAYSTEYSFRILVAPVDVPEGEIWAPSVLYVLVASILGTCTGFGSRLAVRCRSPGEVCIGVRVAMLSFHVQDIKNQKLLRRLIPPPVLKSSLSHCWLRMVRLDIADWHFISS